MIELLNWMIGAVLVAIGSISVGCGAGMMWRAWQAVTNG